MAIAIFKKIVLINPKKMRLPMATGFIRLRLCQVFANEKKTF